MITPRILVGHGPRVTEDLVVSRVEELRDAARRDLALLARPVRIVVPSISLRDHLSSVLVRRCGALAGVRVTTLFSLALELLQASGRRPASGSALFGVLVRRFARLDPGLRDRLDDLVDGYAAVGAAVRDFFDAGFEEIHTEVLDELLATEARRIATPEAVRRARALLSVATATRRAYDVLGLTHRSLLLREARGALEEARAELLPTRELLVHGFADATGVVSDLLETLLRVFGGTLYLDQPTGVAGGVESVHTERLAVRLAQVARVDRTGGPEPAATSEVALLAAPDPNAELREIAERVRRILESGTRPEAVGLVARDLSGRGVLVRRHLRALGIPFSGGATPGPIGRAGRDLGVLREILRRGPSLALEIWLDAVGKLPRGRTDDGLELTESDAIGTPDLRGAFFARGASRLEDLSRLDLDRLGDNADLGHGVDANVLAAATAAGKALAEELDRWLSAEDLSFAEHLGRLWRVVDKHLGWSRGEREGRAVLEAAVEDLDVPYEITLSYDELVLVILEALRGRAAEPLGGRGGGVRVLSVMEARGLTFEHLFVFAVNRGVFPRPVREDALLPDRLRRALVRVLPDLPVKASGFDEERYLFAQLLASAPRVTLSWHLEDAGGKAQAPSPLVDRLRRRRDREIPVEPAPRLDSPEIRDRAVRPVEEELLFRALHAGRPAFAGVLPLALEEAGVADPDTLQALARSRLAVLEELDPDRRRREGRSRARRLGPYFGFLGPVLHAGDPRRGDVYVTTLENLAVCPWQTFLRRLLRVAPLNDPLGSLPRLRGRLVGQLVHRVLERIADRGPDTAAWPDSADLEIVLNEEAERLLAEQGMSLKGLARAAAELARPYLESARRIDWAGGRCPAVRRVEATEALQMNDRRGQERRIRFKADRVDDDHGRLVYTDYKTGTLRKTRRGVRENLLGWVRSGEWLQAAAYVYGNDRERSDASGRYVFLRPDLDDGDRIVSVDGGDAELRGAFEASAGKLLELWDHGYFFPRLVEPHEDVEPPRCASCRVAEACLRRDSGSRGRLRRWAEARLEAAEKDERSAVSDVFLDVWWLRAPVCSPRGGKG